MRQSHLAKRYAGAFVGRVMSGADPAGAVGELKSFYDLIALNKELKDFFHSPLFSHSEKITILQAIIKKTSLSEEIAHIVKMMLEHSKFQLLRSVVFYAEQILNDRLKKTKATVISAVEIPAAVIDRLDQALKKITGRIIDLKSVVDPSLLGGIKVSVGSVVYDGSLKGQLENLKEELIKG